MQNKPITFRYLRKNSNPALKGNFYPTQFRLPSRLTVSDDGVRKVIRLVDGARSVFLEDQLDQFGDIKPLKRDVVFKRGLLTVHPEDKLLLQYLRLVAKQPAFRSVIEEVDEGISRAKEAAIFDLEDRAFERCKEVLSSIDECKAYLRASGVRGVDDMEIDAIKHLVRLESRKDPKRFLELANSEDRKVLSDVTKAQEQGLIELQKRSWFDVTGGSNERIVGFQIGAGDPTELFVEWLKSEGKDYYAGLKKRLK